MKLELIDDEFEICVDCMMFDAGYDEHETGQPYSTEHPPWNNYPGREYTWAQNYSDENDDAEPIYSFSWSPCDACGSPLAGDRYEGHLFKIVEAEVTINFRAIDDDVAAEFGEGA